MWLPFGLWFSLQMPQNPSENNGWNMLDLSSYTQVNLAVAASAMLVAFSLKSKVRLLRLFKISLLAPLLSFPWLYFGVAEGAWAHGDPGPHEGSCQ